MGSPAAAVGGPSELLDVHVDQFAPAFVFVADRCRLAGSDGLAAHRVQLRQPWQTLPTDNAPHGAGGDAELSVDPVRSVSLAAAELDDALL